MEHRAAQPEFWDEPVAAQKTLQELNDLKSHLQQYQQWRGSLEDAGAILELLELEADEALLQEAESNIVKLHQDLDRWEPIFGWLEEKLDTPLTPRDFRRPAVQAPVHRLPGVADDLKPA